MCASTSEGPRRGAGVVPSSDQVDGDRATLADAGSPRSARAADAGRFALGHRRSCERLYGPAPKIVFPSHS
jgi:hypothetical protein